VENVVQNWISGGRFKIFVHAIKEMRSLAIEKILVFIGAMQRNIVTKSGRDDGILWGEAILWAQLGICVSGPESSSLMFCQFLFIMLSILAKWLSDWVGRRL
jgi:hypothetical protein